MMRKKILICAVNYKNYRITETFLKMLARYNGNIFDVIIVDNEADEAGFEKLKSYENDSVKLLRTDKNLGYFGGAKYAIETVNFVDYEYIIISNNDIEIDDPKFFDRLLSLRLDLNVGGIATKTTVKGTKFNQNPFLLNEISTKFIWYNSFFLSSYYLMSFRSFLSRLRNSVKSERDSSKYSGKSIFAPHGAFIVLTKEYFKRGGVIDDGYFLYGEELSVAYQCKKMDLNIIYNDTLEVIHNEHQTTSHKYSRFKYEAQKDAFKYILEEYKDIVN